MTFVDAGNNIICAVVVEDNNAVEERSDLAIYIDGERVWDTRNTTKFYVTGRPDQGKTVSVTKVGDKITVTYPYADIKKTFTTTNANTELRKVTWYCAAYKTYSAIHNNLIRAFTLTKHNVEYYQDIPNFLASGDIISLDYADTKYLIKRVIGLPGDDVDIIDNQLYINNELYEEDYLDTDLVYDNFSLQDLGYTTIPEDMYLVLGDNREDSLDSREIGLISKDEINGKIVLRIWPINKIKFF